MERFVLRLADIPIAAEVLFPSTRDYCRAYLTGEPPQVSVVVTAADIAAEREKSAWEDRLNGVPTRHFSDRYLETLALYRKIAKALLEKDVLLFHGAVIAMDGQGFLFTAPSGTGKTTHIRLWQTLYGSRVTVVNGDKPLLRFTEDGIIAYGTPWCGKEAMGENTQIPLKSICVLRRGAQNHIEKASLWSALPLLIQQAYRPEEEPLAKKALELVSRLHKAEIFTLQCNMQPEAARVSHDAMVR